MSERLTDARVYALAAAVSGLLPEGVGVSAYRSSGRWVLDEIATDRGSRVEAHVRTLRADTRLGIYEYLHAMRAALWLAGDARTTYTNLGGEDA